VSNHDSPAPSALTQPFGDVIGAKKALQHTLLTTLVEFEKTWGVQVSDIRMTRVEALLGMVTITDLEVEVKLP